MKNDKPPFSWPIPVDIPVPPGGNEKLIPWSHLKFNPLGLYHLRRWQGVFPTERGFFISNQPRFEAADVAWFAAGMHEDGAHDHPCDHFHPLHNDVRREISDGYTDPKAERKALEKRVQNLTFDLVRFQFFPLTYLTSTYLTLLTGYTLGPPCWRNHYDLTCCWHYGPRLSSPSRIHDGLRLPPT